MHYFIAKNFLASMNTTGKITNVISVVGISLGSFRSDYIHFCFKWF